MIPTKCGEKNMNTFHASMLANHLPSNLIGNASKIAFFFLPETKESTFVLRGIFLRTAACISIPVLLASCPFAKLASLDLQSCVEEL